MHYIQYPVPLDLIAFHQYYPSLFPAILQSTQDEGWDILFALPEETRLFYTYEATAFIDALTQLPVQPFSTATQSDSTPCFPFSGGWFLYAAYELLHALEPSVLLRISDIDTPIAALIKIPAAILYDRQNRTTWLVAETPTQLSQLQTYLNPELSCPQPLTLVSLHEEDPEVFLAGVAQCKQYIMNGDVFQVNLSRGWDAVLAENNTAVDVYCQLRLANPAPFSACVSLGNLAIISSSPERLVRVKDGWIEVRPIAGTHPRAEDLTEDQTLQEQLVASHKEQAEHIMLIDLARNDLGRICQTGTIEVNELMCLASYTHVHHIESNVRGRLRVGMNMADILRAIFPGGTITGCPKVRTMQIIRELETRARQAYTGSLGYINKEGTLDLNILIRTFVKHDSHLYFRAGAGIVADSCPQQELQETRVKAKGLLQALRGQVR